MTKFSRYQIKICIEYIPDGPVDEGSINEQKLIGVSNITSEIQLKHYPHSPSAFVAMKSRQLFRDLKAEVKKAVGVTI